MGCKQVKIRPTTTDVRQSNDVDEQHSPFELTHSSIDLSPVDDEAFTPTICQQRQAAIDNMSYRRAIDEWRPTSIEQLIASIEQLSAKQDQIDRAWIIFYWISQNIRYDTNAYFGNNIGSQEATTVFQSRKAVNEGYSTLYAELCTRTGLECRKVNGYAKGYSFDMRQVSFDKTNHVWNVLTFDNGHLYFIDATWGAGHLDGATRKYKTQLAPHYFLCRPEHMIYGHLPEDAQWQLLAHPLSIKQYLMLYRTYETFFEFNLNIVSPVYSRNVDLKNDEIYGEVLIEIPHEDVQISGALHDDSDTKVEGGDRVYFDRGQNLWHCHFTPQKIGKHTILIFAGKKSDTNTSTSKCAVKFLFDIDRLRLPSISYALPCFNFSDYNLEIVKPANSCYVDWPTDKNISYCEILVRSPDDVRISTTITDCSGNGENMKNGSLVNFDAQTSLWQCLFAPSASAVPYKLTLFAKHLKESQSHCVAQFGLRQVTSSMLQTCVHFPETYRSFHEAKCHLFEPLTGVLNRGSIIQFHCRIPDAHEVVMTVDGQWLKIDSSSNLDDNHVFECEIRVGQNELTIWVNFNKKIIKYVELLRYTIK